MSKTKHTRNPPPSTEVTMGVQCSSWISSSLNLPPIIVSDPAVMEDAKRRNLEDRPSWGRSSVIPRSTWHSTEVGIMTPTASSRPSQANSPDKPRMDIDKPGAGGKDSSRASTSCIEEEEQEIEVSLYQEEDEH
jgi:hypothetical protein